MGTDALAKLLLFERLGPPAAYAELLTRVSADERGKPSFLGEWEKALAEGEDVHLRPPWDGDFVKEWLTLPPMLAEADLRGAFYVSREHAPLISPQDRLSSVSAELLTALLQHPDMAGTLKDTLIAVPRIEMTVIMDRLLERARQEEEWGVPPILNACLAVAEADPTQGSRLAAFLIERLPSQIRPNIVPKIADQPWASGVFAKWANAAVSRPVKGAITARQKKNGNVAV